MKTFNILPSERSSAEINIWWEFFIVGAITCGFLLLAASYFDDIFSLLKTVLHHHWLRHIAFLNIGWTLLSLALLASRTFCWFRYRPFRSASFEDAPTLTVVIPAYNEGAMVRQSIDSAAASVYPEGRLKIVAVDDGSKDDTWDHILAAAQAHPDLVVPVRLPKNKGKRAALAEGFRRAQSEAIAIIDSDSVVDKTSLLALAGPFRNPKVGAVAGKVTVYNVSQGFIPRLLYVNFLFIADFIRSWESLYGTVHCCPGALMAVRASAAQTVLERWLNQTFFGAPCSIGDDRALTNFILSEGYDTVYQRSAVVHTVVPATYSKLCRMLIRWDRSYIREELNFLLRVVWRRPLAPLLISFSDRIITNAYLPIQYLSLPLFLTCVERKMEIPVYFLLFIGWISTFYLLYYYRQQRSGSLLYAFIYPFYSVMALFWIFPYSLLTAKNRSWMTR